MARSECARDVSGMTWVGARRRAVGVRRWVSGSGECGRWRCEQRHRLRRNMSLSDPVVPPGGGGPAGIRTAAHFQPRRQALGGSAANVAARSMIAAARAASIASRML